MRWTGSAITRQDVIGQREQRVALRAGRESVERLLGAVSELDGTAIGVIDRRVVFQRRQQLVPLLARDAPRRDDVPHDPMAEPVARLAQQVDQGQRHFALAQVAADRLADGLGVASEIKQVVDELKRNPEIEAVLAQRLFAVARYLAEPAAELRATAEQVRR